ncbi:DHA2 family multidrug resistance protein-like MFS transporter [Leucobacter exalbidus]|uniref:DHA2 family multidrug resistance protein-like MFS transporter n=1 Tax=Leucobacter exalbidus TaxID=662960 RepID=A0A940PTH3_9MICO|nr:MFS transporter [Leucobacter exalbidus]MBP1325925.1 DHA2 family multidrug resistance protein-like MFS transporter [Leucobacter exalbidus]
MSSPTLTTLSRGRRWAAVAVLTASLLVIMMDMTILNIALPEMAAELHPDSDQQLWIIDVYSLVLAGLLVPFAAIADRWGRKRMLLLGYLIFGVASLLVLWAPTADAVIAVRALLGVGGAMIMPTTLSLIRVMFTDPRERATALSIWAAVSGLGAAIGPLLGGFLLEHFSWHSAFLVNVPLMLIAFAAGVLLLPESRVPNPGKLDFLAAGLALVGMTLTIWAIKMFGKTASFTAIDAWIALLAGLALLAWFGARCVRSAHPLLDLALFRSRVFSAGIIAALGSMFAMAAAMLLLAQWLQLVGGASPIEAGIQMLPIAITSALASLAAPLAARYIGTRAVLAGGIGFAGIGLLLLGVAPGGLDVTVILGSLALIGVGMGSLAIGSAMIMMGSPEEKAGSAGALEETSYELGAVLGVAVLGSISALLYRAELTVSPALAPLSDELSWQAHESLGAAVSIAQEGQFAGLAQAAGAAFTHSLQITGVTGGILMLIAGAIVFVVTPKGTDISGAEH